MAPFFRPMLRAASAVICDSEFIRGELRRLSPTGLPPCHVVPLALPPAWGEALRGAAAVRLADGGVGGDAQAAGAFTVARPLRVLAVGRQSRIKGFEVAMAALGEVVAMRGPVMRMQVAGEAPALAGDRPQFCHAPWLQFMGRVDDARLAQAYAEADVFVNVEYNQPAFGLVALEALTAGCPVVVSRRGALPEVLGDAAGGAPGSSAGGWVVEAGDAQALARVLMEILDAGPAALEARRLAAAARASAFDPATYFVQLFEVLDGAVNDGENA
jgi:glycosyltransferase involved in cell wall biosynthesis